MMVLVRVLVRVLVMARADNLTPTADNALRGFPVYTTAAIAGFQK